jgi:3-oxoacyl-[acyl-carrier protein] reductase
MPPANCYAKMRNVIVTGGSRGLGLGIAEKLAGDGFQVIAVARGETEAFNAASQRVAASGQGALAFYAADLADIEVIPALVKSIRRQFGPLYGLVNNAGLGTGGLLSAMNDQAMAQLLRLNIHSPIALTKYVSRTMMTQRGGRIVNISSIVASDGFNALSVYSATKAALIGFTRSLARELGPLDITVNAVAPGFISTEMTSELGAGGVEKIVRRSALRRMAEIEDVGSAVAFLFSEGARNITGTVMTIDAGNTA